MKPSLWSRFRHNVKNRMVSGLLIIFPLGITLFILQFLLRAMAGLLQPMMDRIFTKLPDPLVMLISIALFLLVTYFIGVLATLVLGRRLIALAEAIIVKIPLVKTIYSSSKQVLQTLSLADQKTFKAVVFIEFPGPGMRSLGFVTGRIVDEQGVDCYKVFVPTTPNPTSG